MKELFERTALLLGEPALARLAGTRVAVAGVGGVGSYTVEALARSGIGSLLLIDNDQVALSNINRQLHATTKTVGQDKTKLMAQRCLDINPDIQITTREAFILPENVSEIFSGSFDYIVDAVDTVSAKLAIVEEALLRGIPLISVMGAGNKLDPTRLTVGDIYETSVCPLCRVMRHELRKRHIPALKVVYSTEPPLIPTPLAPPPGSSRRQTPGSTAFVPSVAGLIAAGEVVLSLCGVKE